MTESHTVGVTGAAGYIGSRVGVELLEAGHDLVPVDDFSRGDVEAIRGVEVRECDVRDRAALRDAFADVDAVMHLAAMSGVEECDEDPERAFDVNVGGTENVAWLCRERGLPMVFPCSMAVVGDPVDLPITADHPRAPLNFYGRTKAMSEDDVHQLAAGSFPAHVLLISNLYGHHRVDGRRVGKRTVINVFVDLALDGEALTVHRPGTQARDFVHVRDVARAYLHSLEALLDDAAAGGTGARTFPVASGDTRSVREIAGVVRRILREERGEEVEVELVENPRASEAVSDNFTVDTAAARELTGFEAEYDVERAVREMVRAGGEG